MTHYKKHVSFFNKSTRKKRYTKFWTKSQIVRNSIHLFLQSADQLINGFSFFKESDEKFGNKIMERMESQMRVKVSFMQWHRVLII